MVVLALLDSEADEYLGEEGFAVAEVPLGVEPEHPGRVGVDLAHDVVQGERGDIPGGVGARVGEPRADAAIVVRPRLEGLQGSMAAFQLDTDALGGLPD